MFCCQGARVWKHRTREHSSDFQLPLPLLRSRQVGSNFNIRLSKLIVFYSATILFWKLWWWQWLQPLKTWQAASKGGACCRRFPWRLQGEERGPRPHPNSLGALGHQPLGAKVSVLWKLFLCLLNLVWTWVLHSGIEFYKKNCKALLEKVKLRWKYWALYSSPCWSSMSNFIGNMWTVNT